MRNIFIASSLLITCLSLWLCGGLSGADSTAKSNSASNSPSPSTKATSSKNVKAASKPKSKKWGFSLLPTSMQRNPLLDFTIVTELTDEGRKLPPPSFGKPVYYKAVSVGYHVEGQNYGNQNPMLFEQLQDKLLSALASNGYRLADKDHPATQTLRFVWGMHNKLDDLDDMFPDAVSTGDEDSDDEDFPDPNALNLGSGYRITNENYLNVMSRAKIVGGTSFARDLGKAIGEQRSSALRGAMGPFNRFLQRDDTTISLVEQTFNDCYYIIVQAFETESLEKQRVRKLLWQTNMTTGAQGVSLEQTMPGLIENGAYFFGRETKVPEIVTKRSIKEGKVEIGEATVEEYIVTPKTSGTATPAKTPKPKQTE